MIRIICFILTTIVLTVGGFAQPASIVNTLKSMKSEAIGPHLDNRVEVTIEDYSGIVNAAEASRRLAEFFDQKKPSRHTVMHDAQSKGESTQYIIGSYSTSVGNYRSYFFLREKGNKWVIQEIRIEKE